MNLQFYLLSTLIVAFIGYNLYRNINERKRLAVAFEQQLHDSVDAVVPNSIRSSNDSFGVYTYEGRYQGRLVQIRYILDTLATRKLPTFWMSVTVFERVIIEGTYDLMNRPAGLASFSNFHALPFILRKPIGLYEQCELRSDISTMPTDRVPFANVQFMRIPRAKELLVSPKGVRIVWTIAEADRLRYGVFRNADFNDLEIPARLINDVLGYASSIADVMTLKKKVLSE